MCGGSDSNHAEPCIRSNYNILSLYGNEIPYNICRNAEWQICGAKGTLPGQGTRVPGAIKFAKAPKDLDTERGPYPLGSCNSYHPRGCGNHGYASSDIFYMEVCLYDQMCNTRDSLWTVEAGEEWVCHMEWSDFAQLRDWLVY